MPFCVSLKGVKGLRYLKEEILRSAQNDKRAGLRRSTPCRVAAECGGRPMGLTYISKNCEIYLGEDSAYRDDMGSLPLDCILTAEEYNALPEEQKKEYEVLVPKPKK
jgi:hypothetical protein